jgi:uncharacterized protein (DUF2237 family)
MGGPLGHNEKNAKREFEPYNLQPLTGFLRDGDCRMPSSDLGSHGICSQLTHAFLDFTRSRGNELISSVSAIGSFGLKAGDRWYVCTDRWREAHDHGVAPPVILASSHADGLKRTPLAHLKEHAMDAGLKWFLRRNEIIIPIAAVPD